MCQYFFLVLAHLIALSFETPYFIRFLYLVLDFFHSFHLKFKLKQNELILGNPRFRKNEDGIIFQYYNDHYLTPSIIRETIQDYHKKAGVDYKGTHVLRHTHAVLLLESGASLNMYQIAWGIKPSKQQRILILILLKK